MKSVAVFIKFYSIGKSSPVLCLLEILLENYYVDLYIQDAYYLNVPLLKAKNIQIIDVSEKNEVIRRGGNAVLKNVKYISLDEKRIFSPDTFLVEYSNYICIDPHSFVLCKEIYPDARPVYFSLELYFKTNSFNLNYPPEFIKKERRYIKDIKGLMIQSEERDNLFREEYKISSEIPTFIFPVTYSQSSVKEKSRYLRDKYNIPDSVRIALHLGGIQEYHSCIELAIAFAEQHDWVLIFHGYYFGDYAAKFKAVIAERNIRNVIINDETFDFIEDMGPLLMSADIGIAWYNNVSPNFTSAGKSSGKISAYLRFGLPVIVNRYRSTEEAIEQTGAGICVDSFDGISKALLKITEKISEYSEAARREYDKVYWLENYKKTMIDFFEKKCGFEQSPAIFKSLARNVKLKIRESFDCINKIAAAELISAHVLWCLKKMPENNSGKVALFGAGKHTEWLLSLFEKNKLKMPDMIIDDNPTTAFMNGVPIFKSEDASVDGFRYIFLSTDIHQVKFAERIKTLYGSFNGTIVDLYWNFPPGPYEK